MWYELHIEIKINHECDVSEEGWEGADRNFGGDERAECLSYLWFNLVNETAVTDFAKQSPVKAQRF